MTITVNLHIEEQHPWEVMDLKSTGAVAVLLKDSSSDQDSHVSLIGKPSDVRRVLEKVVWKLIEIETAEELEKPRRRMLHLKVT